MARFEVVEDTIAGNDRDLERIVTDIVPSDPLVQARMIFKTSPSDADPGILQKVITTTSVAGEGHISADGSVSQGNGTATLVFQLTAANTILLGYLVRYWYEIKVKTSAGKLYSFERGRFQCKRPIVVTGA